ncbi:MAG: hypothetical protein HKN72_17130 [Gemmatimonadetes bacterium]|nr:hypothetical protein [Gemmatimonadota bacterium]NNF14952.1 hypothetical protein [Gemmatimonadota bacterium]NNL30311.1 hypothetical protein [Gemmatimonadota bacterium]
MLTLAAPLQAATGGSSLALAADLALTIIAVAIVAVAVMSGILMLRFNRVLKEIQRSARQNFGPVSDRARSISDNVEFITQALRTDVEKLNASVRSLSDRLQQASDRLEERVEEFNALMSVVQGEAEDIFLDTASTVRGVREGARAIGGGPPREGRPGSGPPIAGSHPPGPKGEDGDSEVVERAAPPADDSRAVSAGED